MHCVHTRLVVWWFYLGRLRATGNHQVQPSSQPDEEEEEEEEAAKQAH